MPSQGTSPASRYLLLFCKGQIFVNTEDCMNSSGLHCAFSPAIRYQVSDSVILGLPNRGTWKSLCKATLAGRARPHHLPRRLTLSEYGANSSPGAEWALNAASGSSANPLGRPATV